MKNRLLNIAILIICISAAKSQTPEGQESYIARAGNKYISEREFLHRYELLPAQYRNRQNNVEESKLVFLYSLVAEKLLAQSALTRHLDQDSVYRESLNDVRSKLARDQLYRKEISGKVKVSKKEVQSSIADAQRRLLLSFIYFEDAAAAHHVRRQLKNYAHFDRFQFDTTLAAIRDTATLVWGEAEASIEEAGFRLKQGECSPVVKASTGYYILQVDKVVPNTFYVSMDRSVRYERVEKILRLRKEYRRLDAYLQKVLRMKTGYSLPRSFKALAAIVTRICNNVPPGTEIIVTDSLLQALSERCRSILRDSLVVIGASHWTVQDALSRLRGKAFVVDTSKPTGIAAQLNSHLRVLVQQELLSQEALAQKLDESPSVKKDLAVWQDKILANLAELDFRKDVRVSDEDVFQYLAETDPGFQYPRVQICELHARSREAMEQALAEVRSGKPLGEVVWERSSDLPTADNDGISDEFAINTRNPIGLLSWKMNVGERMGPLHIQDDYIFFELVKKIPPAGMSDSAWNSSMRKIATEVRSLKQKRGMDAYIAKLAHQHGYDIYVDRLKLLKVSHIPMMTYRILGFGGRMFAAPFVSRQVDWTSVENAEDIRLP